MKNIVVIGGGIAGLRIARKLHATLVTASASFLFLPLLTDTLWFGNDIARKPIHHSPLTIAKVLRVDPHKKFIITRDEKIPYDILIIATGAKPKYAEESFRRNCLPFYSIRDKENVFARALGKKVTIIGGGPTGVELAAELARIGSVMVVHQGKQLLEQMPEHMGRIAHRELEKLGVEVLLHTCAKSVGVDYVELNSGRIQSDCTIWTAGIGANLIEGIPSDKGILVNKYLQVQGHDNIFAVGDCAQTGNPLTAQAAIAQANCVIKNIRRLQEGMKLEECTFYSKGLMLTLGRKAIISSRWTFFGYVPGKLRKWYYQFVKIRS